MSRMFLLLLTLLVAIGCKESVVEPPPIEPQASVVTAEDIPADTANTGSFTFFRLSDSSMVALTDSNTTNWDIAFRGTSIIINGGTSGPGQASAVVLTGTDFDTLSTAPASGYVTDSTASKAVTGWYTYTGNAPTPPRHTVLPNPGTVIVLHTAEGEYAKVEIVSYYKGAPEPIPYDEVSGVPTAPARFYTFRYFYQPDGSTNLQ
ncbi:MAG: HmuY family protein [Ignavibacteriae bacterium]|nr:HmuY family protein [Ignavibacteriota bacterium]